MKIVILDGYTENPGDLSWEELAKLGELTVYDRTPAEEIVNRIGDAKIVITNKTPISRETMDACPNMKYIAVLATGYNVVDVNAAKEKGIPVNDKTLEELRNIEKKLGKYAVPFPAEL